MFVRHPGAAAFVWALICGMVVTILEFKGLFKEAKAADVHGPGAEEIQETLGAPGQSRCVFGQEWTIMKAEKEGKGV